MNASLRKGWCPGALRPMAAKDGLLVRLRITGGILTDGIAHALADLATRHGNGLFDLSARGNLQMRGVGDVSLPALQDDLRQLGLLDRDAAAESVRNVIASPLAGLHDGLDIRPLVRALETRLTDDASLHALPGKFGFVISDGSIPSPVGLDADVCFDFITDGRFAISLGARDGAVRIGTCDRDDLVESAVLIARSAIGLFAQEPQSRRMRDLIAIFGIDRVAGTCGGQRGGASTPPRPTEAGDIVGHRTFAGLRVMGLAAPFGRLDVPMLHAVADIAATTPVRELRLTPWRTIHVPGASPEMRGCNGFIVDPGDPRLAVVACVGASGCERGTTATHVDALRLAAHAGIPLHVSGCAKGCAKPSRSPLTLVARDGRYDLVRDGRADDTPSRTGLDLAAALDAILEPA